MENYNYVIKNPSWELLAAIQDGNDDGVSVLAVLAGISVTNPELATWLCDAENKDFVWAARILPGDKGVLLYEV